MSGKSFHVMTTEWVSDTGASHHRISNITLPDARNMKIEKGGIVQITKEFILKDMRLVPSLTCNLISIN